MVSLYVLRSIKDRSYYIGTTNNIDRRLIEHNNKKNHYTSLKQPWTIIYSQEYKSYSEARKEEIRLKKGKNKGYIEWYIKNRPGSSMDRATSF